MNDLVRRLRGQARPFAAYGAAAAISIVAAIVLLQLPKANLRVPFDYSGDAFLYSAVIKSIIDHGWFWTNPSVAAPAGLQLFDYPNVAHESLHLLTIKILSAFSGDWALLLNVYFLLGFPLIALSAMAVFRQIGIGYGAAIVGSVLYSFLPSRLIKGEGHIFLDVFYQVPLAILVVLWVCSDNPPLVRGLPGERPPTSSQRRTRTLVAVLVCVLSACTSAYYSFFTIFLLVVAGLWSAVERRSMRNAVAAFSLTAVIVAGLAANGLPSILYHLRNGPNVEVGLRGSAEAEIFGMKIAQLLLPADGHRVTALRRLKQRYNAEAPLTGENSATSLGLVGAAGFLVLIAVLLGRRRAQRVPDDPLQPLAVLNLVAVLMGTIGGFGSLFALLIYPQIRTYSRLNVFIAFFALAAVLLLLDRLKQRRPALAAVALPAILILGLLDQTTALAVRPYADLKATFDSDRDFVHRIEAQVPPGTVIFELPFVMFPEGVPLHRLDSYGLLRPYLHSSTVRWSLPVMRGRSGEVFVRDVSQREPGSMLQTLARLDFGGVLINRDGFDDAGAAIETALRARLDAAPLVSADGRLAFFSLTDYRRRAPAPASPAEIDRIVHPLATIYGDTFYGVEHDGESSFRWCRGDGEIHVDNETRQRRPVSLRMTLAAAQSSARLTIGGDLLSAAVAVDGPTPFAREIEVPPGHHVIRISCNCKPADAPNDPRRLLWRVHDLSLEERPALPAPH